MSPRMHGVLVNIILLHVPRYETRLRKKQNFGLWYFTDHLHRGGIFICL
jgi:hypothetical protein